MQTDHGGRQQKLRESPYALRETHSDAQGEEMELVLWRPWDRGRREE